MISRARCVESLSTDPYGNLAVESCLFRDAQPGQRVLYLWQNERTVVVGRNQHASAECNVERLEMDGGHLARRLSGGGAVYHDLGNLNFTFVSTTKEYDQAEQTGIILDAVRSLGIKAERTGRNDLVTSDLRKFSGHAFYHSGGSSYHHGTIMVGVDVNALSRYLNVDPEKLRSKGVRSVRSRVANLQEYRRGLTVTELKEALVDAFGKAMGKPVVVEGTEVLDLEKVEASRRRLASTEWIFRGERRFDETCRARFDWGIARIDATIRGGVIRDLAFFSDGLDAEYFDRIPVLLIGSTDTFDEVEERLRGGGLPPHMARDVARLLAGRATSSVERHTLRGYRHDL